MEDPTVISNSTLLITSGLTVIDVTPMIAKGGLKYTRRDLTKSIQTMDGKTHRGRVAVKAAIELQLIPATYTDYCDLAAALEAEYVAVTYQDPAQGQRTVLMYVEERSASLLVRYPNDVEYWHEISFTLQEA